MTMTAQEIAQAIADGGQKSANITASLAALRDDTEALCEVVFKYREIKGCKTTAELGGLSTLLKRATMDDDGENGLTYKFKSTKSLTSDEGKVLTVSVAPFEKPEKDETKEKVAAIKKLIQLYKFDLPLNMTEALRPMVDELEHKDTPAIHQALNEIRESYEA